MSAILSTKASVDISSATLLLYKGTKNASIYLNMINKSSKDVFLTNAECDKQYADHLELHDHITKKNNDNCEYLSMVRLDKILIPQNGQTILSKGGKHIMIMNFTPSLWEEPYINLILTFTDKDNKSFKISAKIKIITANRNSCGCSRS
jgi:copper(I)-binding protein